MLEAAWLESSFEEIQLVKIEEIQFVKYKLSMSPNMTYGKGQWYPGLLRSIASRLREVMLPFILSTGKTSSGKASPVLRSPLWETWSYWQLSPAKGHWEHEGTGASCIQIKDESWDSAASSRWACFSRGPEQMSSRGCFWLQPHWDSVKMPFLLKTNTRRKLTKGKCLFSATNSDIVCKQTLFYYFPIRSLTFTSQL